MGRRGVEEAIIAVSGRGGRSDASAGARGWRPTYAFLKSVACRSVECGTGLPTRAIAKESSPLMIEQYHLCSMYDSGLFDPIGEVLVIVMRAEKGVSGASSADRSGPREGGFAKGLEIFISPRKL